jgi:hypothetical protein
VDQAVANLPVDDLAVARADQTIVFGLADASGTRCSTSQCSTMRPSSSSRCTSSTTSRDVTGRTGIRCLPSDAGKFSRTRSPMSRQRLAKVAAREFPAGPRLQVALELGRGLLIIKLDNDKCSPC